MNLLARHVILRALLRWTAAVAFCIPLKHRPHARLRALGMLLPLLGLTYVLDPSAQSTSLHELQFSLLTLYVAFFVLLGMMIYACVEIDKKSALYCAVWSLLASQTAYECWHLVEVFFEWRGTPLDLRSLPVMLAQLAAGAFFYFVICTTLSRKMSYKGAYNIGPRQLTSAFFIGILFMFQAALLSGGQVVVLDRSLVMTMFVGQFYFLTLLYFQTEVFKLSAMQKEMDTLNLLYERQREQYQVARQNVQIINKRCHELKLQIAALRDDMPMTAVRAGNIIVVSKAFAYAGGNGFLAEVQMHKAGDLALSKKALCLVFKLADTYHPKVHIHHSFFSNIHSNSLLIDFLMCFRRCAAAV